MVPLRNTRLRGEGRSRWATEVSRGQCTQGLRGPFKYNRLGLRGTSGPWSELSCLQGDSAKQSPCFVKHFPFPICVVEICDLGSDCSHFIFQNQVSKPIVHKYDMLSFTNVLKPRISFCSFARMREKGNENEFCVYPFSVWVDWLTMERWSVYLSYVVNKSSSWEK